MPLRYQGGHHEDELAGAWMRVWGSNITSFEFGSNEYYDSNSNLTQDAQFVAKHADKLVVFHRKKVTSEFIFLRNTLLLNEHNSLMKLI